MQFNIYENRNLYIIKLREFDKKIAFAAYLQLRLSTIKLYTVLLSERSMVKLDEVKIDCRQVFKRKRWNKVTKIDRIYFEEKKNFFFNLYLLRYLYIINKHEIILT